MMYPGQPLIPPIKLLLITHGVAMSLWMLLAITQPLLVAGGNRRMHMALGKIAAGIAVCLVALGLKLGIASTKVAPPDLMYGPLTPKQFMLVPVGAIALFALFVTAGVLARKRPDIHRPMMFMATMTVVGAAISRIDFLNHLYAGTVWEKLFGVLFFTPVIASVLVVAKCVIFRKFDNWLAAGFGVLVLWCLMIAQGAPTRAWDTVAGWLLG
jgi:type IV secretory pathway TrbD component